jgi:hypothetical protein
MISDKIFDGCGADDSQAVGSAVFDFAQKFGVQAIENRRYLL